MEKKLNQPFGSNTIDQYVPELQEQLAGALNEALLAQPSLCAYALVDSAFSETCIARLQKMHADENVTSLYRDTELDELTDVSPFLVQLSADQALRSKSLKTLLRLANGKPMLSFLTSALNLEQLKAHFTPILQAETEDGQRLVLRFADTRILPVLITTLDKAQQSSLLWPIAHWWHINRMGKLNALPLPHDEVRQPPVASTFSALPLSAQQFSSLLDSAEADVLIEQLRLIAPEHCAVFEPGNLHQFVHEQLQHATQLGVDGAPDRIAYCIGAFNAGGKLHENTYAKALFKEKLWQPGDLADALSKLPEECWETTTA